MAGCPDNRIRDGLVGGTISIQIKSGGVVLLADVWDASVQNKPMQCHWFLNEIPALTYE